MTEPPPPPAPEPTPVPSAPAPADEAVRAAQAAAQPAVAATPLPHSVVRDNRRWLPSLVWFVPLIAAIIGGWTAWQAEHNRGETIVLHFLSAEGIEAGKTRIRYKDVDVGTVTALKLARDRQGVDIHAQMSPDVDDLLNKDTRFWIVTPRLGISGVSGLNTLLSGSYVGMDVGTSKEATRDFTGLEIPPLVTTDRPGRQFRLRSDDIGFIGTGSPVYLRRMPVGQIIGYDLDQDGKGAEITVFVNAPYDQFITQNTRFWRSSGLEVDIDASGLRVNTESLLTMFVGGIAFQNPTDEPPGEVADANASFSLFDDRTQAMRKPDRVMHVYLVNFRESLRGLATGAPVDFRGIVIGEVKRVTAEFDGARREFRTPVELAIYPERLRSQFRDPASARSLDAENERGLLEALIARGLRAQIRATNLLTGQLAVTLDFFPNAPKAKVDPASNPPEIPSVPGSLEDLQESIGNIIRRVEKVPFDDIARDLRRSMASLDRMLASSNTLVRRVDRELAPQMRDTLESARATLRSADKALGAADRALSNDSPLQDDLRGTLREVSRAAEQVRSLTDYLERHPESLIRGKGANRP